MSQPTAAPWYTLRRPAAPAAGAAGQAHAAAKAERRAELWVYGDIGESWFEDTVAARTLVKELAEIDAEVIDVHINSYGGSVSDGIAIYNALVRHPAQIHTHVDGIAASIASLIAMAGTQRNIAENARIMVHAPWAMAAGNANKMRLAADMLDGWAESMASTYASATGKPVAEVKAWLTSDEDHYFGAAEAVAQGLAHSIVASIPVQASASAFAWAKPRAQLQAQAAQQPITQAPAAAAAQPPSESNTMTQQTTAATPEEIRVAAQAAATAATAAEFARQAQIRAAAKACAARFEGVEAAEAAALADPTMTAQAFKAQMLDLKAKEITPAAAGYVVVTHDEADKQRQAQAAALEIRAGLVKNDESNPWRGRTLMQMAENALLRGGVREASIPQNKIEMVAMAFTHGTSDFPGLLANIANKAMLKGYEEQPETFQLWTNKGSLPDFKQGRSVDMGAFGSLRQVRPGAEFKYITAGERGEVYQLATYGELFGIDRQTIINDDLGAFSAIPRKLGRAARRTVGDLAYLQLTANPTMADAVALFHATHNNLQAASGITTTSVDAIRTAMARQKDVGQTSGALNIELSYLIVPKSLDGSASTVRDSEYEVTAAARNNTTPNSQRNRFQVISDARLDEASTSIWYGCANPAVADTVTMFYLDGNENPFLDSQNGWNRDGVEFKVRIDAAAKAMDWRGMQRNG